MQKAHWHALQSVPRGSAVLFPSKKHADATRAFASGFRGRNDGLEGSHATGRLEDRFGSGRGTGTAATAAARAGGGLERREEEGREMGTGRERACKKGRGGGGRK